MITHIGYEYRLFLTRTWKEHMEMVNRQREPYAHIQERVYPTVEMAAVEVSK